MGCGSPTLAPLSLGIFRVLRHPLPSSILHPSALLCSAATELRGRAQTKTAVNRLPLASPACSIHLLLSSPLPPSFLPGTSIEISPAVCSGALYPCLTHFAGVRFAQSLILRRHLATTTSPRQSGGYVLPFQATSEETATKRPGDRAIEPHYLASLPLLRDEPKIPAQASFFCPLHTDITTKLRGQDGRCRVSDRRYGHIYGFSWRARH